MNTCVLVAEPEAVLAEMYARFLLGLGYQVETADNGLECLRKLQTARPRLLVLACELLWGGADGVLDWIRENDGIAALSVILTVDDGAPDDLTELVNPPVVACLKKPFRLSALSGHLSSAERRNAQCVMSPTVPRSNFTNRSFGEKTRSTTLNTHHKGEM